MARYDLTDFEWSVIEPLLPMDRRGPKPQNNRQIMNGMFYILRAGCPWRDLPERYGPYTTVYNRFNRWRKAGIWDRLMDAIVTAHDGKVQMIDSSIVRVSRHCHWCSNLGQCRLVARACRFISMPPASKKEWSSLCRSKPGRAHDQDPRARRWQRQAGPPPDIAGERPRHHMRAGPARRA